MSVNERCRRCVGCFAGWLGIIGSVTKDRTRRRELARDVQIVVEALKHLSRGIRNRAAG